MFEGFVARMVDRAMPPNFRDPEEENLARDVAEYAIRRTARVAGTAGVTAGIAGVTLVVVIAVILYMYFPRQWIGQRPSEMTRAAPQSGAEANAMLRQAIEDLQKRLDIYFPLLQVSPGPPEATSAAPQARAEEHAKLRQALEDLQKQLDDVTKERDTLQGKVAALQGQAAALDRKLPAAKALTARKAAPRPPGQATRPARTPALASGPSTYACGDGRTVQDPAECKPASASEEVVR
jgi:hypothetical protein